ncbi:MAG: glutathione S-transferase, partial [Haliea sp.]|nr:glutathione S-transferase [Haliea sp.]
GVQVPESLDSVLEDDDAAKEFTDNAQKMLQT